MSSTGSPVLVSGSPVLVSTLLVLGSGPVLVVPDGWSDAVDCVRWERATGRDVLVVVSATLSRVVNHVHPDVVRSHWPGQGDALEAIQRVSEWSERKVAGQLPRFVRRLLS